MTTILFAFPFTTFDKTEIFCSLKKTQSNTGLMKTLIIILVVVTKVALNLNGIAQCKLRTRRETR